MSYRALFSLMIATLIAAAPSAVGADDVPDAATIEHNVAVARGTRPTSWSETVTTTYSNGGVTVTHELDLGDDRRTIVDEPPFHTENGLVGGKRWRQNANGQVVLVQPDPEPEGEVPTTTTVQRVHVPFDAYVVARLTHDGLGVRRFVDPLTWHVVRIENATANGTIVTTFDDFRTVVGFTLAQHWHAEDPVSGLTSDTRVTDVNTQPVTASDVAIPPPQRALVEFPAGVDRVTLPTVFQPHHVDVHVMIGDRMVDLVLDSGAGGIFLDSEVAKSLGLSVIGRHEAVTAQRHESGRAIVPEMRVGSLTMRNVAITVGPLAWKTGSDVKEVGLLGFDFIAELGLTIDYANQTVTAVPTGTMPAPTDPGTIALDVRLGTGQPLTSARVNGSASERWMIDTGAGGPVLIFSYFARRHPEALRDAGSVFDRRQRDFYGIGGAFDTKSYRVADFQLGPVDFKNFLCYLVTSKGAYDSPTDGTIGPDFLKYFTVSFDYVNSRLYLVPNRFGQQAMHH